MPPTYRPTDPVGVDTDSPTRSPTPSPTAGEVTPQPTGKPVAWTAPANPYFEAFDTDEYRDFVRRQVSFGFVASSMECFVSLTVTLSFHFALHLATALPRGRRLSSCLKIPPRFVERLHPKQHHYLSQINRESSKLAKVVRAVRQLGVDRRPLRCVLRQEVGIQHVRPPRRGRR